MSQDSPLARHEDNSQRLTLLDVKRQLTPEPRVHYIYHKFEVPEGARRVGLIFSFHKERLAQLFLSLYGPEGFRGTRMNPGAKGDITLELWCAPEDASEGGITGKVEAGEGIPANDEFVEESAAAAQEPETPAAEAPVAEAPAAEAPAADAPATPAE